MLYFTVPSLDSELAKLIGFDPSWVRPENERRMKRVTDNRPVCSPNKQRKSDGFAVTLDVSHFQPEDIQIRVVSNDLIVTGKHGERSDENGYISRQFTRRYELPEDIDLEKIASKMSSDGKLVIEAPLIQKDASKERVIPITFAGKQSVETKTIEKSEEKEEPMVNGA